MLGLKIWNLARHNILFYSCLPSNKKVLFEPELSFFICSLFLRVLNLQMNEKFKRSICKYHLSLPSQWETGGALLNLERDCEEPHLRVVKRATPGNIE